MDVSIIIINYKTYNLVFDLLKNIKEKTIDLNYEIIIVDNSNSIEEFEKLCELKSENVIVLNADKNLGFGKGNNFGVTKATGDYLFFLNSDTLLINNAVKELLNVLKKYNNVGIVGANLYNRSLMPNGSFIRDEKNICFEKKYNSLFEIIKRRIKKRSDFNFSDSLLKINGYVSGAALMISRADFIRLNGFDEDIFMYAEESLLCRRLINELKKDIYNVPKAKIIHFEGESFKCWNEWHTQVYVDGNFQYYLKSFGKEEAQKYLKTMVRIYKNKRLFAAVFRKKELTNNYDNFIKAYREKIESIKDK